MFWKSAAILSQLAANALRRIRPPTASAALSKITVSLHARNETAIYDDSLALKLGF
jgi:hypothetical protein